MALFDQSQIEPKKNEWEKMNTIQKSGVVTAGLFFIPSLGFDNDAGLVFGQICWASFFVGYVAGAFWKVRHALHFWYSTISALVLHACVMPVYSILITRMRLPHHEGRPYYTLAFGLLITEVLFSIVVMKKIAMHLHRKNAGYRHV